MKTPFLCLACAMVTWAQTPAHAPHYPNISNATYINDAMEQVPASLQPGVNTWMGQRFDWILGGTNIHQCYANTGDAHGGNLTQVNWAAYGYMPLEHNTWAYQQMQANPGPALTAANAAIATQKAAIQTAIKAAVQ